MMHVTEIFSASYFCFIFLMNSSSHKIQPGEFLSFSPKINKQMISFNHQIVLSNIFLQHKGLYYYLSFIFPSHRKKRKKKKRKSSPLVLLTLRNYVIFLNFLLFPQCFSFVWNTVRFLCPLSFVRRFFLFRVENNIIFCQNILTTDG